MKLNRLLPSLAVLATVMLGLSGLRAEETTSTLKFSDPAKPGTLKVILQRGDVSIDATDGGNVTVRSDRAPIQRVRKDGLRVLTESAGFDLREKDNVITLDAGDQMSGGGSDFNIVVPRNTNVVVTNSFGGDIRCRGVSGDIDIKSLRGEVCLDGISGSAVVDTMNGGIDANVQELPPGKALSFTSMNGEVTVRVPPTAKANVRLRTQNGSILTDFDAKTLVTSVENVGGFRSHGGHEVFTPEVRQAFREAARAGAIAAQQAAAAVREAAEAAREGVEQELNDPKGSKGVAIPPVPPIPVLAAIPSVTGGKLVTGTLNGGGPEISVTTMNGDVTLRQLKHD